ncbi:MAG TPA: right-handed parallel beta-helix repeat-containing protein [Cytophagaceae bacterium]
MPKLIIPILLFFQLSFVSAQNTYYVSVTGNNANIGSLAAPFRTIQHAVNTAASGDIIYVMDGVYNEKVNISKSGITLSAMAGHNPVIDGNDGTTLAPSGRQGLITIINKSNIKITGFEIRDFSGSGGNTPVGIYIEGRSNMIEVRNNKIHGINGTNGAHGIGVFGVDATEACYDLIFDGNEIYDCKLYWSEAFVLNGNVRNFEITNNSVHDCDNIAYDFIGYEGECSACTGDTGDNVDRARDGYVAYNIAYNIDTKDNLAYGNERSAAGFYVDGGHNIIFEGNISHDCNIGIELASEHYGKATSDIIVRNNLIYNNHIAGIATGGYSSGTGEGGGQATNCIIINNTLYHNNNSSRSQDDWGAELFIQNRNINNTYQNNIIIANNYSRVEIGSHNSGLVWANNLFSGAPGWDVPASGNPVFGNPGFVNPALGNFNLTASSDAIDKGAAVIPSTVGTVDFNKNSRVVGTSIDIGAFEYNAVLGVNTNSVKEIKSGGETLQQILYPNPAADYIAFHSVLNDVSLISYKIIDVNGKVWKTGTGEGNFTGKVIVSVDQLAPQVYYLVLQYEDKLSTISFVKR